MGEGQFIVLIVSSQGRCYSKMTKRRCY